MRMNRRNLGRTAGAMIVAAGVLGLGQMARAASPIPGGQVLMLGLVEPEENWFIDLAFEGGTAEEYIEVLREAAPDINIVAMADLGAFRLPAMELRKVSHEQAVEILNEMDAELPDRRLRTVVRLIFDGVGTPIYAVHVQKDQATGPTMAVETRVWPVRQLLEHLEDPDQLVTAVETALELAEGRTEQLAVRFHEESGLLIARGHEEHVDTIESVLEAMYQQMEWEEEPSEAEQIRQEYEAEVRELESHATREIEMLSREIERAEQYVQEAEVRRERDLAQANELRGENAELRAMGEVLAREREELRGRNEMQAEEIDRLRSIVRTLEAEIETLRRRAMELEREKSRP